ITPLADGFDGGAGEFRISLAIHDAEGQRSAVHPDNRMKNHGALDARYLGSAGIHWRHLVEKFCRLYFAADTQPRQLPSRFRSRQWFNRSFRHYFHFLHDCSDFHGDVLTEFAAGFQHNLRGSRYLKSALDYFHLILTGWQRLESEIAVSV